MEKINYICFSSSCRGSVKYAVENNMLPFGRVVSFEDDLSLGPLDTIEGRLFWWEKVLEEDFYYKDELKNNYSDFHKVLKGIGKEEKLYIFYGENAMEIMGLMYTLTTLTYLENKLENVYTMNVSSITYNKNKINEFTPRAVGEVSPERLEDFIKIKKKLEKLGYEKALSTLEKLKKENTHVRIYKENKIISKKEDYYDDMILKYTDKNYKKAARTIGNVLGYSDQLISDSYIFWRIKQLIKEDKIDYKGDFNIMRFMEIKIKF